MAQSHYEKGLYVQHASICNSIYSGTYGIMSTRPNSSGSCPAGTAVCAVPGVSHAVTRSIAPSHTKSMAGRLPLAACCNPPTSSAALTHRYQPPITTDHTKRNGSHASPLFSFPLCGSRLALFPTTHSDRFANSLKGVLCFILT